MIQTQLEGWTFWVWLFPHSINPLLFPQITWLPWKLCNTPFGWKRMLGNRWNSPLLLSPPGALDGGTSGLTKVCSSCLKSRGSSKIKAELPFPYVLVSQPPPRLFRSGNFRHAHWGRESYEQNQDREARRSSCRGSVQALSCPPWESAGSSSMPAGTREGTDPLAPISCWR